MEIVYFNMVPTLVDLARPLPPLTYLAPEGLQAGTRVEVKIRNSRTWGVVLGPDPGPARAGLKAVEAVLDPFPLLPRKLMELLQFAAGYYGCGLAHLVALCLPPGGPGGLADAGRRDRPPL